MFIISFNPQINSMRQVLLSHQKLLHPKSLVISQEKLKSWMLHLWTVRFAFVFCFLWEYWMLKSTGIFSSRWQTRKTYLLSVPFEIIFNQSVEIPKWIPIKAKRLWKSWTTERSWYISRRQKVKCRSDE